ncbi:glycosyltransferase family 39 protein [Sphingomonas sp. GV3]|uniref:glycosyltransferase family 39 protein n=1 Tax=Sphingomonas sp. GV3 TaxID=3040671 RepID=UPI00280AA301|nr:glycosyltransferase family 39 protein [Sphingomonas sp. GV3]
MIMGLGTAATDDRGGLARLWLILTIAALVLRLPDLGNPVIDLDEQMYLLVGSRMWHGALPYVDIWDRKPIGLFLVYAGTQGFGGDSVVAYQWAALVAAIAAAGIVALIARSMAGARAAVVAGLVYLVWIALLGGRGGQAPVFYNPLVALAALLVWRTLRDAPVAPARCAMLLIGLAIEVKPTAVVEGVAFAGLALMASWRRDPRAGAILREASLLAALALVPTFVAAAFYVVTGHGDAWWFANVRSIFLRHVTANEPVATRLEGALLVLVIPLAVGLLGLGALRGRARLMMATWLSAAIAAWLAIPPYYNHYALPLLVPVAVAAGIGAARRGPFLALLGLAGAALLVLSGFPHAGETAAARRDVARGATLVHRYAAGRGCPFVFQAPPVFYTAADACLPTRYPFASHLTFAGERGAIGVDPADEVLRILRARPPVIVTAPPQGDVNPATFAIVMRAIAIDYRPVGTSLGYTIYARREGS